MPQLADKLRDANVVRLKLVQAQAYERRDRIQAPGQAPGRAWEPPLGDVVGDEHLQAEVRVDEQQRAEDGVGGRVERAGGKGRDGQGHNACGDEALKGPVVGAVAGVRVGDGGGVVDCVVSC